MKCYVTHIEEKDNQSFLVYARKGNGASMNSPIRFLVQKGGDLLSDAMNALDTSQCWDVPLDRFTQRKNDPGFYEELVTIDLESMVKKAFAIATKARFSNINSAFVGHMSDKELLDGVKDHLDGDIKLYKAQITTLLYGQVYKYHDIKPLYAEDDDDAFKVALALLEQLEGRQVTPNDLMACEIKLVYENKTPSSYSNKRLKLKQSKISPLYKITHRDQYNLYNEVLTFENGFLSVQSDELTIKKSDGTVLKTHLEHFETDYLTETYIGQLDDGSKFRFVKSSDTFPLKDVNPFVGFASISKAGWAVHFYII